MGHTKTKKIDEDTEGAQVLQEKILAIVKAKAKGNSTKTILRELKKGGFHFEEALVRRAIWQLVDKGELSFTLDCLFKAEAKK
jgi:hypothetical protein